MRPRRGHARPAALDQVPQPAALDGEARRQLGHRVVGGGAKLHAGGGEFRGYRVRGQTGDVAGREDPVYCRNEGEGARIHEL